MSRVALLLACVLCASCTERQPAMPRDARNDIPSCRELFFQQPGPMLPLRDYFIIVDRTVVLDRALAHDTVDRIARAMRPGDRLRIISFSGLTDSEFTLVQFDGRIDVPPTESELETQVPSSRMSEARQCFPKQVELGRRKAARMLMSLLEAPLSHARRSEILKAMTAISHQSLGESGAPERLVVVLSDMLEFSDVVSFYDNRTLRLVDVEQALAAAKKGQLVGDFKSARVYVAGAAVAPDSQSVRGLQERQSLQEFWRRWFQVSNASIIAWGEPALLEDIR